MKLYYYDHCPYCVKARMIFGLTQTEVELIPLLNDDETTPMNLIGVKMVPILIRKDGRAMPESMDIVTYIDHRTTPIITGKKNPAIAEWLKGRDYYRKLCYPRWVAAPLPEFKTDSARAYFTARKEEMIGSFTKHLENTPELKQQAELHLHQLEPLIQKAHAVNGTVSEDDFHLFAALRSLTIVKDLQFPSKVLDYILTMSQKTNIPLHISIAR